MRLSLGSGLLFLLLVHLIGPVPPAHAWTRTRVEGASATIDIERDASLGIFLRLDVKVDAGWLHELELAGLGDGVELNRNRPPYVRSEDGELFRPEAEVDDDGLIHLTFPRKDAPRRGEYRVFIRYRTRADVHAIEVEGEPRARVVWSMPAWETSLQNVSVQLRAPRGSSVPNNLRSGAPGVDVRVTEGPHHTLIEWSRIQFPRLTAWPLTLDVPIDSITVPAATSAAGEQEGFRPLSIPERRPILWPLALLAGAILLKRRSIELRMGRRRLWVQAGWAPVLALAGITVAAGQWLTASNAVCALPLLALTLHRAPRREGSSDPKDWRPATIEDLPAPRLRILDLLDGTTAVGLAVLLSAGLGLVAVGQPSIALLLLPVFLTGTRHHGVGSIAQRARMLRHFASELCLPSSAPGMSFAWERASDGATRLRAHLPTRRAGLNALAFVIGASRVGFAVRQRAMLLVETRSQSDADDLMRRRTGSDPVLRTSDGNVYRLLAWDSEAVELLRVLAQETPKPVKASRGTWLLREISGGQREAA